MRRFLFGTALLTILLFSGLWVSTAADRMLLPISETLQQASRQCVSGDLAGGQALADQAKLEWDSIWNYAAVFTDHAPMDEIDSLFGQMQSFRGENNAADFAACCSRLSRLVHAVAEAHSPTWWNIF